MWYFRHHARRFFRGFMKPIDPDVALKWHKRFRYMYLFSAISAFGVSYYIFQSHQKEIGAYEDLDTTPSHRQARLRGHSGKVIIYRFGWGKEPEYYEFDNEKYTEEYNERVKKYEQKKANVKNEEILTS